MAKKRFKGRYENLHKIADFVRREARSAGLDEDAVYQVELAVDEACTNIIEHAYGGEGHGSIECQIFTQNRALVIELRDQGRTFNPNAVSEPNFNLPIEQVQERGVGLFLIRKLMDGVNFQFGPRGNILTLIKNIPGR